MRWIGIALVLLGMGAGLAATPGDAVLHAMQAEMTRSIAQLCLDGSHRPYFVQYHVREVVEIEASAVGGALEWSDSHCRRALTPDVRVGSYAMDNTSLRHTLMNFALLLERPDSGPRPMALGDAELPLRHDLWLATDDAYKAAVHDLALTQAERQPPELPALTREHPTTRLEPPSTLALWDKPRVEALACRLSSRGVDERGFVRQSTITTWLVNSEGTVVRTASTVAQTSIAAPYTTPSGIHQLAQCFWTARTLDDMPPLDICRAGVSERLRDRQQLAAAPLGRAYHGPVLYSANAAADLLAGNTLSLSDLKPPAIPMVELPSFLNLVDDPTLAIWQGNPLIGGYVVDDEGVPAQRVAIVNAGQLGTPLLSRHPVKGYLHSNGHGRDCASFSNLVLSSTHPRSFAQLKQDLLARCRARHLPEGRLVTRLSPLMVYRVRVSDGAATLERDVDVPALSWPMLATLDAAGSDAVVDSTATVEPMSDQSGDAQCVVCPALLFDAVEVTPHRVTPPRPPAIPPP